MSGVANREVANKAMEHYARGFIPKSLSATSFINAIKFILAGERYLPFDYASSAPAEKIIAILPMSLHVKCKRSNSYASVYQTKK